MDTLSFIVGFGAACLVMGLAVFVIVIALLKHAVPRMPW